MAGQKLQILRRLIREELRAEGADGAGYSDFFIDQQVNACLRDLSELFTIRDSFSFTATLATNSYSIATKAAAASLGADVENVLGVDYDGSPILYIDFNAYREIDDKTTGDVEKYTIWGDNLILIGAVTALVVKIWVTRGPKTVKVDADTPETPYYADEAIAEFVVAACYRESKDYERASFHWAVFQNKRQSVARRATPQGQRDQMPAMKADYWGPVSWSDGLARSKQTSDTDPGGN